MNDLPEFKTTRQTDSPPLAETSTPSTSDGGAHLDTIRVEEIEQDHDAAGIVHLDDDGNEIGADFGPVEPEKVTRDGFYVLFRTSFDLPGQIMPDFKPLGIQPTEQGAARAASDALYSLLEIYYPAALLPQSETLAHLLTLGPFLIGKVMVMRAILNARNAPPIEHEPPKEGQRKQPPPPPPDTSPVDWMAAEQRAA
ncbi:hypothetical protein [Yoonia sp.]|uniref:hypothetical protein n=1 Tax=Yoonia sp. TaxID=2212373 RepID=UPI002E052562|nr:hypothetical protein [Yoonia sp.]